MTHVSTGSSTLFRDDQTGLLLESQDGIAMLTFDQPHSPINTLGTRAAASFAEIFDIVQRSSNVDAVVLLSGKVDTWIAGADIEELSRVATPLEGEELSRMGQQLLGKLAAMQKPSVAAIHGAALGGGLETALACTHRISTDSPKNHLCIARSTTGFDTRCRRYPAPAPIDRSAVRARYHSHRAKCAREKKHSNSVS